MDPFARPASFEELHATYYKYVVGLVRKLGIEPQRAEDVAQDILLRLYERNIIEMFDPDKVIKHRGEVRPARFKSFLSSHVEHYVRGKRERQNINLRREPLKCDQPVSDGGPAWIEVFGPTEGLDTSDLEMGELLTAIRAHLATVPRRSKQDIADLPRLFECMWAQAETTGKYDVKILMKIFGVSNTAIHSWIGLLRTQIRVVLEDQASERV